MMKYIFSLIFFFLLSDCASREQTGIDTHIVYVAPDVTVELSSSPNLPHPVDVSQLVIGTYGEHKFAFQVRLSGDATHFDMAGLDMSGQRTIGLQWTTSGVAYEAAPWIPSQLAPQYILADLVLIYWPQADVQRALNNSAILVATKNSRSVTKDGATIIDINYQPSHSKDMWQKNVHYENKARGYSLDIQSAPVVP